MIGKIMMRIFLGILFYCMIGSLSAQDKLLQKADSLFDTQKFTEALEAYQELYEKGFTSSAVLLKMAFIQDASGNYPEALFYMNKYYQQSADRTVIGKIEEVAQENELRGYRYDDMSYFSALLNKYRSWVIALFVILVVALAVYSFEKIQSGQKPVSAFILQLMVAILFFIVFNLNMSRQGIIISDQALLRSGPSAGAESLEIVGKGHRVKIVKQDEVWTQIIWQGNEAYIRSQRLKTI